MKAHYGTTPIPIPPTYTSPQQIGLLSRDIQKSIKALRDRPVIVHGGGRTSASSMQQFKVKLVKDGEIWKATVHPGWVITSNPASSADPVLVYSMPTMGGIALDAEEPPKLEVAPFDTIYLKLSTTEKGVFSSAEIVADEPDKDCTHNQPPTASVAGEMYYKLVDVVVDEDSEEDPQPPKISTVYHVGPFYDKPNLPELENVLSDEGENYEVFKERDAAGDKYLLRAITQLEGSGVPVLKPHPRPEDAEPDHPGNPVDTIPVRRIRERNTSPQVRVGKDGTVGDDFIQVEGNGYEFNTPGVINSLTVKDGLITAAAIAGSGYTGSITIVWTFNPKTGSSQVNVLKLTFSAGILITVGMDTTDGTTDVTGTSNIEFFMTASDT
jgi:hypothetical protein